MKILIAEDNVSNKILMQRVLKKNGFEVISADDGLTAFALVVTEKPDLVLTDWMMPKMDGLALIEKVKAEIIDPPLMIMITAIASAEAEEKIIKTGADAFLTKPQNNDLLLSTINELIAKQKSGEKVEKKRSSSKSSKSNIKGVVFAASTGGPPTLTKVFSEMKLLSNASIFIVLHGPAWMLESFAEKLDMMTPFDVFLGQDNQKIVSGAAYLAPGDMHMVVDSKTRHLKLLDTEPVNFVKPAADPLFQSVAQSYGENSIGIVLTGMGRDGTIGSGYIKAAGGYVIAQDPDTAILHAMPKSVVDMCIANSVVSVEKIASAVMAQVKK